MSQDSYCVYFDGCCEPKNPGGTAGYGVVILKDAVRVFEHSGMIPASPTTSNNVAEYLALLSALDWFLEQGLTGATITMLGDSKLVINQMWSSWQIRDGYYAAYAHEARKKAAQFHNLTGAWIPRDQNIADDLSKTELRKAGVELRIQPEGAAHARDRVKAQSAGTKVAEPSDKFPL
jgi:ribonuclease HI